MKIKLSRKQSPFLMEAVNPEGNSVMLDAGPDFGGYGKGIRPTELVLMGVAGCSGIDILSILEKQKQTIDSFDVEVDADKEKVDTYSEFKELRILYSFTGDVDPDKAKRAIDLSLNKYCSVSKLVEKTAKIIYTYEINGKKFLP